MGLISMVDLRGQYQSLKKEIDAAVLNVLDSSAFIQGPDVHEFARNLSRYMDSTEVITCGNGTDALQISMMALNLQPGDEVIVPAHTYVATAEVIALLRLKPVFVDVEERSFNIDVDKVRERVTSRTRAIVPVHLYGQCANLEGLQEVARDNNLFIIEDAAQALGANYIFSTGESRKAGTIGTIGTGSFFPTKSLGCYGDGGVLFTSDKTLATKIRKIANHGQQEKYYHELVGVNSRLDTLQAAILGVKLLHLDEFIRKRNEVANHYDRALEHISQVKIPTRVSYSTHVFHQYTLIVERRDELRAFLKNRGVASAVYYPLPLHLQKAYQIPGQGWGTFEVSERLSKSVISLPIYPELSVAQRQLICDSVNEFFA